MEIAPRLFGLLVEAGCGLPLNCSEIARSLLLNIAERRPVLSWPAIFWYASSFFLSFEEFFRLFLTDVEYLFLMINDMRLIHLDVLHFNIPRLCID